MILMVILVIFDGDGDDSGVVAIFDESILNLFSIPKRECQQHH